jgi:hypothetical protein
MYTFPGRSRKLKHHRVPTPRSLFSGKSATGTHDLTNSGRSQGARARLRFEGERGSPLSPFACLSGEALVVLGSLATHLQHTHNARVIYRTHSFVIHGVTTV